MHVENWETDHIQNDLYVDISYKFTFACMYTNNYEHLHKWFGTFYRDSVLMKACIFNNHKSWSLSLFAWTASLIATCNFYFSDYVCTLLLQTILVKVWLCTKTRANTHCCRSLNNYQHWLIVFTAALPPTISSTHYYWHTSQIIITLNIRDGMVSFY